MKIPIKNRFTTPEPTNVINLIYIRAAIEAKCGVRLDFDEICRLLVEEGLCTPYQILTYAQPFRGYSEFYEFEEATTEAYSILPLDVEDSLK